MQTRFVARAHARGAGRKHPRTIVSFMTGLIDSRETSSA
jgi:hypothetical protein